MREQCALSIYVLPDCPGCERARWTAGQVRERCPGVRVELVDLNDIVAPPPGVFSVPTYVLNGRVISLGNPPLDELLSAVDSCIGGGHGDDD